MNKGIGLSAIALASSLFFTSANANDFDNKFIVGASFIANGDYKVKNPAQFNVGYQFHQNFAVELSQIDYGKSDNDDFEDISFDGYAAAIVAKYPLGNFNLYGKLGAFSYSEEGHYYDPFEKRITGYVDNSGTAALFGAGASYHFNEYVALKFEIVGSEENHYGIGFDVYF